MSYVCSVCGEAHEGLAAWVYRYPDLWLGLSSEEQTRGKCSSDLCRTGDGHYFVRAVLRLPLIGGSEETFEFGLWCSLNQTNFERYVETFDDVDQSRLGPMFGWLSNEVSDFPGSLSLKTSVHPQDDRQRPLIELEPTDHPLAEAQRKGISMEKVSAIIHRNGDVRIS